MSRVTGKAMGAYHLLGGVACLLASVIATACGSHARAAASVGIAGLPALVTQADINSTPRGSPQRSVVTWFQAIQYRDYPDVVALLTTGETRRRSSLAVQAATDVVGQAMGRPQITQSTVTRGTARVRLVVLGYLPDATAPSTAYPLTMSLLRVRGTWLIDDASYLMDSARVILRLKRGAG